MKEIPIHHVNEFILQKRNERTSEVENLRKGQKVRNIIAASNLHDLSREGSENAKEQSNEIFTYFTHSAEAKAVNYQLRQTFKERKLEERILPFDASVNHPANRDRREALLDSKTNLIAISAGNTRAAIAIYNQGELIRVDRLTYDKQKDWAKTISEGWDQIKDLDSAAIVGASVNRNINDSLSQAVQSTTNQEILWIGKEVDRPIPVLTDRPEVTGLDRILNVAAAHEIVGGACLVVDPGTAITIDCGDQQGRFLGGVIGPGVAMMLRALHEQTAALPQISYESPPEGVGKNTQDAMRQGILYAMKGMVSEAVTRYSEHLNQPLEVIATGGDAESLFQDFDLVKQIVPDLTLQGVAIAYRKHLAKDATS
jgi:type III pantothenate kinase